MEIETKKVQTSKFDRKNKILVNNIVNLLLSYGLCTTYYWHCGSRFFGLKNKEVSKEKWIEDYYRGAINLNMFRIPGVLAIPLDKKFSELSLLMLVKTHGYEGVFRTIQDLINRQLKTKG